MIHPNKTIEAINNYFSNLFKTCGALFRCRNTFNAEDAVFAVLTQMQIK